MKTILAQLQAHGVSQRRACKALRLNRSSARYVGRQSPVNEAVRHELLSLARRHRRWGSPRLRAEIRNRGHAVNHKRVARLYKESGLTLPRRRPKRKRPGPTQLRDIEAKGPNEVWSYDFVHDRTQYGEKLKLLVLVDEYSRECLEIRVEKRIRGKDVLETLDEVMHERGAPRHIRSDNGSEFRSKALKKWLDEKGVQPVYVDPGSPWQNGYVESLNGKLRDECLNEEVFFSRAEAQTVVDWWRSANNEQRPHMSLGYRTPMAFAAMHQASKATAKAVNKEASTE